MKKFTFLKTVLTAVCMLVGVNAWAYTPSLTGDLVVSGYKVKAYYDISSANVNSMCATEGDFRYRGSGYGMFDFGSGNRSGDVVLSFSKDDIVIFDFRDSQSRNVTVNSVENCTKDETLSTSTGFLVFKANANSDAATTINVGRGGCIIAILVMEKDDEAATANYTINYNDGEKTVKTVSGSDVAIGTTIYIESSFFKDDVKYVTDGGQISSFDVVDGTNVYNIEVSEAAKYSYTVNATDGTNVLKVLASASTYEGEQVKVAYPQYINVGGTLYTKAVTDKEYRQNVSITENNQVVNFVYTESDIKNVVYHSEGEEIIGATATSAGSNMSVRSSNAQCGYTTSDLMLINLPAGKYTIYGVMYSNSSAGTTLHFQLGEDAYDPSVSGASNWNGFSQEFTLASAADVKWLTSGDSKNGLDYVYIQKTADIATITSAGYATYCSNYALDFSGVVGLTAYIAKVDESKNVTFDEVTTIPANTGVLLKGDEGNYNIPILASADAIENNAFIGVTEATEEAAGIFVLMATPELGFYRTTSAFTVGANTAYLPASVAEGRSFIWFDEGGTTAIQAPAVKNLNAGEIYTLGGQRVAKPTKGLYIQNGKKVIIK